MKILIVTVSFVLAFAAPRIAASQDAYLRVVDVGNGLCVVASIPGGGTMLYDAGDKGSYCQNAVREIIGSGRLDLVVLSHSDADHIGELPAILAQYPATRVVYPGDDHLPLTDTITRETDAIQTAARQGTQVWNLAAVSLDQGDTVENPELTRTVQIGNGTVTLTAGWSNGDQTQHTDEPKLPKPEHNNAISITARLEYAGHSVLLTGDTVGRFRGDPGTVCAYAERSMVENQTRWPIESDVLIGQHHGGDNASSNCFVRAVKPEFVVFSAGHKNYLHPTQAAADRFIAAGVLPDKMLRTDRGDDEGPGEWVYGDIRGCIDQPGDDDVEIILPGEATSSVRVQYTQGAVTCPVHTQEFFRKRKRK